LDHGLLLVRWPGGIAVSDCRGGLIDISQSLQALLDLLFFVLGKNLCRGFRLGQAFPEDLGREVGMETVVNSLSMPIFIYQTGFFFNPDRVRRLDKKRGNVVIMPWS
jgi:hypothetical protein